MIPVSWVGSQAIPKRTPNSTQVDLDEAVFTQISYDPTHVLHQLLSPVKHTYNLRQRSHSFVLPHLHSTLECKNFIYHMLYWDVY